MIKQEDWNKEQLTIAVEQGKKMAKLIMSVNTDYRGDMFKACAEELRLSIQGYTSGLMYQAAIQYGFHKNG